MTSSARLPRFHFVLFFAIFLFSLFSYFSISYFFIFYSSSHLSFFFLIIEYIPECAKTDKINPLRHHCASASLSLPYFLILLFPILLFFIPHLLLSFSFSKCLWEIRYPGCAKTDKINPLHVASRLFLGLVFFYFF